MRRDRATVSETQKSFFFNAPVLFARRQMAAGGRGPQGGTDEPRIATDEGGDCGVRESGLSPGLYSKAS